MMMIGFLSFFLGFRGELRRADLRKLFSFGIGFKVTVELTVHTHELGDCFER